MKGVSEPKYIKGSQREKQSSYFTKSAKTLTNLDKNTLMLLLFSHPVMSNSLGPHGLQHASPPCLSPSLGVCPSSCSLHLWCVISATRVVSSTHLKSLMFLFPVLIPDCYSPSPAFLMMHSVYRLNKQGDSRQPCCTPFSILNQSVVPSDQIRSDQSLSRIRLFATPWIAARQACHVHKFS